MGTWQEWIDEEASRMGLIVTSGYRTPAHNAAIGGTPNSFHTKGGPDVPGAIDVAGPTAQLRKFFDEIRAKFEGQINELFLNIPGGTSEAIKNNRVIGSNPEEGRMQHLHIALAGWGTDRSVTHRFVTDVGNAGGGLGEKGIKAAQSKGIDPSLGEKGTGECSQGICIPTPGSLVSLLNPARGDAPLEKSCLCWSDVLFYGSGLLMITFGLKALFLSR